MGFVLMFLAVLGTSERYYTVPDPMIPVGQDGGPSPTSAGCAMQAMVQGPKWLDDHAPGWEFKRAICVPPQEALAMTESNPR